MSEAPKMALEYEAPFFVELEFLKRLGWTAITPRSTARKRTLHRMEKFDKRAITDGERAEKAIDIAYYALELSTNLPEFEGTIASLDDLKARDPEATRDEKQLVEETNQRIIDNFIITTTVYKLLADAHSRSKATQHKHLRLVPDRDAGNTGCLAALESMTGGNTALGTISNASSRSARATLQILINDSAALK